MSDSPSTLTTDDIADLNTDAVGRTAALTRYAATVVLAVGAVCTVGWLFYAWRVLRDLGTTASFGSSANSGSPTLGDRFFTLIGTTTLLLLAALAVAIGLGMRLFADYAVARSGGSVTGAEVGDEVVVDPAGDPDHVPEFHLDLDRGDDEQE
jgi:hypothetical protein